MVGTYMMHHKKIVYGWGLHDARCLAIFDARLEGGQVRILHVLAGHYSGEFVTAYLFGICRVVLDAGGGLEVLGVVALETRDVLMGVVRGERRILAGSFLRVYEFKCEQQTGVLSRRAT